MGGNSRAERGWKDAANSFSREGEGWECANIIFSSFGEKRNVFKETNSPVRMRGGQE